jgi:hypothetical protein
LATLPLNASRWQCVDTSVTNSTDDSGTSYYCGVAMQLGPFAIVDGNALLAANRISAVMTAARAVSTSMQYGGGGMRHVDVVNMRT